MYGKNTVFSESIADVEKDNDGVKKVKNGTYR